MRKSKKEIKEKIKTILSDSRMKGYRTDEYHPAHVQVNAPLALIQTTWEGYIAALEWVLNE